MINQGWNSKVVSISVSESPDLAMLGMASEHLEDAMAEITQHLLAMGAQLKYGGDLRKDGFTDKLFELLVRYRNNFSSDELSGISNLLAWPIHISFSREEVQKISTDSHGVADLIFLTLDGKTMTVDQRLNITSHVPTTEEWCVGLTAMRETMTYQIDARVVLGGMIEGFKGIMPGVAEEALFCLTEEKPLFLLGGFGGCASDVAEELGLSQTRSHHRTWANREAFTNFTPKSLNNGLSFEENVELSKTVYIDQAISLILRGLLRLGYNNRSTLSNQ